MNQYNWKELESIGCNPLTGERCAAHMRTLCDVDGAFVTLFEVYFEVHNMWDKLLPPSNQSEKTHRGMMLSTSALKELWVFRQLMQGNYVVEAGKYRELYAMESAEFEELSALPKGLDSIGFENVRVFRPWQPRQGITRSNGTNVSQMCDADSAAWEAMHLSGGQNNE